MARRFRSRAELRAIFAKIQEARASLTPEQMDFFKKGRRPRKSSLAKKPATPADDPFMSPAARKVLDQFEALHRNEDFETGIAIDMKTGNVILEKTEGNEAAVSFTKDEFMRMRDAARNTPMVFSHNHPKGSSFSLDDIRMASMLEATEFRVTGPTYDYSMKPGFSGWPPVSYIRNTVEAADAATRVKFWAEINAKTRTLAEANADHWHEVWTSAAKTLGLRYVRSKRGG